MVKPIVLEFEDGTEYTLEFDRKSVMYAEAHGFNREDITAKLMTRVPELFFYAFRKNHPTVPKEKTDKILFDDLGGLTEEITTRLVELFNAPYETLLNDNATPTNPTVKVRM